MFPTEQVPNVLAAGAPTLLGSNHWMYPGVFVAGLDGTNWFTTLIGPLQFGRSGRVNGPMPFVFDGSGLPAAQPPNWFSVRAFPVWKLTMLPISQFPTSAFSTGFKSCPNRFCLPSGSA